jgi:hypothetical protein
MAIEIFQREIRAMRGRVYSHDVRIGADDLVSKFRHPARSNPEYGCRSRLARYIQLMETRVVSENVGITPHAERRHREHGTHVKHDQRVIAFARDKRKSVLRVDQ